MSDPTDASTPQRFPFAIDPTYGRVGRLFGIHPDTAWAQIDGRFLEARLGPWRVRTTLGNIADTSVTGPYALPLTIGPPHLSFTDRGLTFATNGDRGVCLRFHLPVGGLDPFGLIRHPGLTLTVADVPRQSHSRLPSVHGSGTIGSTVPSEPTAIEVRTTGVLFW